MKYFVIAGEASGDLHGANLIRALKVEDPEAEIACFGGELMEAAGGQLLRHYRDMAFMGAIDVLKNLGRINRNFDLARQKLLEFQPDVVLLIDYPGFNLKMARFAHEQGFRVFYYILPKVWAWKAWRVKKLRRWCHELFSIFPFEEEFFSRYGVKIRYLGNPLLDAVSMATRQFTSREEFLRRNGLLTPAADDKPLVALLPGSRLQEIKLMLPVMSRMAREFPHFRFMVSATPSIDPEVYASLSADPSLPVITGQTYEMVRHAHAALVASGTATLETALLGTPQVVLYKMAGGKWGYRLFKAIFLKVKYVSLPNLILQRPALRELIMDEMRDDLVKKETTLLLSDEAYRQQITSSYTEMRHLMGEEGASARVAMTIKKILSLKS
jgi:lipid-A-disaccharide synthase